MNNAIISRKGIRKIFMKMLRLPLTLRSRIHLCRAPLLPYFWPHWPPQSKSWPHIDPVHKTCNNFKKITQKFDPPPVINPVYAPQYFVTLLFLTELFILHMSVFSLTLCPGSSDQFHIVSYFYKMGHYFLDI